MHLGAYRVPKRLWRESSAHFGYRDDSIVELESDILLRYSQRVIDIDKASTVDCLIMIADRLSI